MKKSIFAIREDISPGLRTVLIIIPFVLFLVVWCVLSYGKLVNTVFLPSPTQVIKSGIDMFTTDAFWKDIFTSLSRVLLGFLASTLLAIPLGILAGSFKFFDSLIAPFVGFIRYMPAAAFIPLLILWVGIGLTQKVAILFISIFFYLVLMVADAAANVRKDFIETAYTLGASKRQTLFKVIVPAALPGIWESMRVMMGIGWTTIVIVELVATRTGIGSVIIEAQRFMRTDKIIVGILTIGFLGIISDFSFRILGNLFFDWKKNE
ncbi:MAG: ABC transporter permease [Candidatus Aminicenantes bacterium]|nr:ABC transporter permease [Candidatus Aminicenantes bacterium]